jgi:hypothetical protein
MTTKVIKKQSTTRLPIVSAAGTGLNSSNVPKITSPVARIVNPLTRKPN